MSPPTGRTGPSSVRDLSGGPMNQPLRGPSRTTLAVTAATISGGLALYAVAPMQGRRAWFGLVLGVAALVVIVPLTVRRARRLLVSDRPILEAAETLVLLFTLLVLGFASGYVVLSQHTGQLEGVDTKIDALYFTLTTLSTVGFGDAHAVGQAARVVVSVQMVFDLVFIATAVRLLASVARERATQRGVRA
jgi:voltage-gated potassium channel